MLYNYRGYDVPGDIKLLWDEDLQKWIECEFTEGGEWVQI